MSEPGAWAGTPARRKGQDGTSRQPPQAAVVNNNDYILESVGWPKVRITGMAFTTLAYTKGQVDRAGSILISDTEDFFAYGDALSVINNWRSCRSYPLQVIKMTLIQRAKKVSPTAVIAQRLKRLPSITIKLTDNPNMKLSKMQDIGGCRAVLADVAQVNKVVEIYEKSRATNPKGRPEYIAKDDYIKNPKPDGYRSIHLIYKYQSLVIEKKIFNGQRIEIQIRSTLQHAWATAVEVAQTFTGQALKSKVKNASAAWLRFFALMGSAIALRENCTPVPGTPASRDKLVKELRSLEKSEKIIQQLTVWGNAVQSLQSHSVSAHTFLLILDPEQKTLRVSPFSREDLSKAQDQYLIEEKNYGQESTKQVVLVSVDSLDALRKAYPNYYADTGAFITAVKTEIEAREIKTVKRLPTQKKV